MLKLLVRSAPSWICLPVLMSLFVTDLLILPQRVSCSAVLHSLCCDCAVSVLTLCRSVLCSSGIWFWEVQCSSWPPVQHRPHQGAPESRADFHSFQVLKSHFSLLGYYISQCCVCIWASTRTHIHTNSSLLILPLSAWSSIVCVHPPYAFCVSFLLGHDHISGVLIK